VPRSWRCRGFLEGVRVNDEELREYVRASRAEQGLPPTIEDPVALAKIAALLWPPNYQR
jgi:hypothetical protein